MATSPKQPTPDQLAALAAYSAQHGRCWKAKLCADWHSGRDEKFPLLRQVRNDFGPRWLKTFPTPTKSCTSGAQRSEQSHAL
jgi:hypothetical protein